MSNEIANLKSVIGRLLDRIEDQGETIEELQSELAEYREVNERDKAQIRQDVHTQSGEGHDSESKPQGEGNETMLPIERLAEYGNDSDLAKVGGVTESVSRAVEIYNHFEEWSSKAPVGRTIRSNLRTLLNTATGEKLAWRQVYRACEKLEEWSKGAIRMKRTKKHGWILIEEQSSSVTRG